MKHRIVINFADDLGGPLRLKLGDILLIARRDKKGILKVVQELQYHYNDEQGMPIIAPALYDSLDEYIEEALNEGMLSVEILAHSPYKSSHHLSSSVTKNCPIQLFTIDELTAWIESDILKKHITQTSISLIICQAASATVDFPSIAEQMFALFKEKPLKMTAREGFVYMRNRDKIYSLSAFDTLLHKAYISQETSANTFLERFSFPLLRGLRTFLSTTQLHTYDNSTPLNEKFAYFINDQNETFKIDKHLYDLYILSNPKPDKKLELCTKEDFINLANLGIKSDKNGKLYKKSEIVLKEIDLIHPAIVLQIQLGNYQKRDQLFTMIDQMHEAISTTPSIQNAKKLNVLLNIIEAYINARYFLNLPVNSTEHLLNLLHTVIANNGQFDQQDFQKIEAMAQYLQLDKTISLDASEYVRLAGLLWPSDAIEIMTHCRQMNEQFANRLETFCKMIKTENQLFENRKIYIKKSDINENPNELVAPEKNENQIHADLEKLQQLIHHQIQETSYLFSFNKFTPTQTEILTSLLQLIHVAQKQEIKNNEPDSLVPLLVQGIKKLVSTDTENTRLKLIEHAVDGFVKKHYNISEKIPENKKEKKTLQLEFFAHKKSENQETKDKFDPNNSLFELD
ncbi:hypothetical protein [Legionella brunensis]|uniref:Uncharacterized protein n=1 Tax=Legionella brunensis TaxID=29422 RepID=A0A0W0SET7_9GAMM|nr:hypothetical protein [Legionella brunensis]KTC81613.1 hypothetical protein Lbru_2133 [Legionella brunensis]